MAFNIAGIVQRALVPTGKTVGGPKKKRGMLAKVVEKAATAQGGGRATTPNTGDNEGSGITGLLRTAARRMRRAY